MAKRQPPTDATTASHARDDLHRNEYGLSAREEVFAQSLASGMKGAEAARAAGYSAGASCDAMQYQMIRRPHVAARVAVLQSEAAARLQVDGDYVIGAIKSVLDRCSQQIPVLDRNGQPVMIELQDGQIVAAYEQYDANAVLRAAEMLGKYLNLWSGDTVNNVSFVQMGDVILSDGSNLRPMSFDIGSKPDGLIENDEADQ
jgi:hypothetical protein